MADRPGSNGGSEAAPGRGSAVAMPLWVKMFGIVGLVLVVMFVILHLTGHGFGHHMNMATSEHGAPPP